ncbi:delta-3,5-delta-2,4-dienoyl-CoA isomerase [Aureococcus anophagefferens]|nr:delta-3,5-delta-2,4-dienoyl-CoA isomerase [Aureococcus anophagefferens]
MLSDRGRCHTFDLRADGYCRGEGCTSVLLDGSSDDTCGVASRSSAVQQDGPSASMTAPNGSSQKRLILATGHAADGGLEAHGTGTALGDPIEVGAAVGALCKDADGKVVHAIQCASLKANMGHLESNAAGAGLAALLLSRMALSLTPPNNQLRTLNTHLAQYVAAGAFRVPLEVDGGRATLAALACRLSSFGFSGTIAHGLSVSTTTGSPPDAPSLKSAPSAFRAAAPVASDAFRAFGVPGAPLLTQADTTFRLLPRVHATIADHVVNGAALFPGVGYVEIAASSVMATGSGEDAALLDLTFVRPCVLTEDIEFMCSRSDDGGFDVSSRAGAAGAFASHARRAGGGASSAPVLSSSSTLSLGNGFGGVSRRGFFAPSPPTAPKAEASSASGDASFIPAAFGLVTVRGIAAHTGAACATLTSTLNTASEQRYDTALKGGGVRLDVRRMTLRGMARQSGVAPASSSELPIFTFGWVPTAPAARDAEGVQVTVIARWNGDGITISPDAWRYRLGAIADVLGQLATSSGASYQVAASGLGLAGVVLPGAGEEASPTFGPVMTWSPRASSHAFSVVEANCQEYSKLMVGLLSVDKERVISLSLLVSVRGGASSSLRASALALQAPAFPLKPSDGLSVSVAQAGARLAMVQCGGEGPTVERMRALSRRTPKSASPALSQSFVVVKDGEAGLAKTTSEPIWKRLGLVGGAVRWAKRAVAAKAAPAPGPRPAAGARAPVAVASRPSAATSDAFVHVVAATAAALVGTLLPADASLMSAGLDSIGATDLAQSLGNVLSVDMPSTLVFDHPSIAAIAAAFAPAASPPRAAPRVDFVHVVAATAAALVGTLLPADASLMSAGLDSIGATDLAQSLGSALSADMPSTLVFDHPSISAIAAAFAPAAAAAADAAEGDDDEPAYGAYDRVDAAAAPAGVAPAEVKLAPCVSAKLPGPFSADADMATFVAVGLAANSTTPPSLWVAAAPAGYGCFVRGGVSFDPVGAFGISRREAAGLDPSIGYILEATYATLHGSGDAANCRAALTNDATGLYVGAGGLIVSSAVSTTDLPPTRKLSVYQGTSQACSVASGRASFVLGLTGPCMSIDTACSSSLCAFHVAASALRNDECPRAAVTGVSVLIYQTSNAFATAGMLSDRGRCHTFDLRADGYCRGEGCASFLLDGSSDEACGVASPSSAVQQDGPSASLTAPNGSSQRRLLLAAGSPGDTGVEAHGTGTALGDPIEVVHTIQCASLKANMGHLESNAAGAGLAALLLSRMALSLTPPNNQLRTLNTHLAQYVAAGAFRMPLEVDGGRATLAALACRLSSFGFSGTIAHGLFVHSTTGPAPDAATLASAPSLFRAAEPVLQDSYHAFAEPVLNGPYLVPQPLPANRAFALLPRVHATLAEHVVNGVALFPGVGYVEIAAASVAARGFDEEAALLDLTFVRPCVLTADIEFMCSRFDDGGFEVLSRAGKAGAFASHARGGILEDATPQPVMSSYAAPPINDVAPARRGFFGTLPAGAPLTKPKTQGDTSFIPAVFGLVAVQGVSERASATFVSASSTLSTATEQGFDACLQGRMLMRRCKLRDMARQSGVAPASSSELPIFTFGWVPAAPAARDAEGVQVTVIARWNGDGSVFLATPRPRGPSRVVEITGASSGSMTIGGAAPSCSITISPEAWRYRLGAIADVLGQLATSSGASYQVAVSGLGLAGVVLPGAGEEASPAFGPVMTWSPRASSHAFSVVEANCQEYSKLMVGLLSVDKERVISLSLLVSVRGGASSAAARCASRSLRAGTSKLSVSVARAGARLTMVQCGQDVPIVERIHALSRRTPVGVAGSEPVVRRRQGRRGRAREDDERAHLEAARTRRRGGAVGVRGAGGRDLVPRELDGDVVVRRDRRVAADAAARAEDAEARGRGQGRAGAGTAPAAGAAPVAVASRPSSAVSAGFELSVASITKSLLGTLVDSGASLMSAGLDSVSSTDLAQALGNVLETELPSTLVFDHPSMAAIAAAFSPAAAARTRPPRPSRPRPRLARRGPRRGARGARAAAARRRASSSPSRPSRSRSSARSSTAARRSWPRASTP